MHTSSCCIEEFVEVWIKTRKNVILKMFSENDVRDYGYHLPIRFSATYFFVSHSVNPLHYKHSINIFKISEKIYFPTTCLF